MNFGASAMKPAAATMKFLPGVIRNENPAVNLGRGTMRFEGLGMNPRPGAMNRRAGAMRWGGAACGIHAPAPPKKGPAISGSAATGPACNAAPRACSVLQCGRLEACVTACPVLRFPRDYLKDFEKSSPLILTARGFFT